MPPSRGDCGHYQSSSILEACAHLGGLIASGSSVYTWAEGLQSPAQSPILKQQLKEGFVLLPQTEHFLPDEASNRPDPERQGPMPGTRKYSHQRRLTEQFAPTDQVPNGDVEVGVATAPVGDLGEGVSSQNVLGERESHSRTM